MAEVSGQYGTVHVGSSEVTPIDAWSLSVKSEVGVRGTNSSSGWKVAVAGTKSGSGTIKGPWDPDDPIDDHLDAGSAVALKLYTTATKYLSLNAIIESLDYEVSIDDGEIVNWSASFQANGAITNPT